MQHDSSGSIMLLSSVHSSLATARAVTSELCTEDHLFQCEEPLGEKIQKAAHYGHDSTRK